MSKNFEKFSLMCVHSLNNFVKKFLIPITMTTTKSMTKKMEFTIGKYKTKKSEERSPKISGRMRSPMVSMSSQSAMRWNTKRQNKVTP